MNQNTPNPYEQYSYDHYDQAPRARRLSQPGLVEKALGPEILGRLRSPVFATAALLVAGVAFGAIILGSYPDSTEAENVPVVQAEAGPFKISPDAPGGMDVPHRDSTIFTAMNDGELAERPPVENLLEQPVDKTEAFAGQVEEILESEKAADKQAAEAAEAEPAAGAPAAIETSTDETAPPSAENLAAADKPKVEVQTIIPEEEKISPQELMAQAGTAEDKPAVMHAPASSPETIAFVRSVLDQKDTEKALNAPRTAPQQTAGAATTMNAVEPASGASGASGIASGAYFIQVGSVKSEDGAAGEWGKIQKNFADLSGLGYRVERADLGDKGIFYRIQAGPTSKENAGAICDSIKAQKPGGCLVVQQ